MAFWNKGNQQSSEQLTQSYMAMYVSSYDSFFHTLASSGYPTEGIDKQVLKRTHDELLLTILTFLFHDDSVSYEAAKTLFTYLVGSRLGVEGIATDEGQRQKYFDETMKGMQDIVNLYNDNYPLESIPILVLNTRTSVSSAEIKPRVPEISYALKKYIEDTRESFGNKQAVVAAATTIQAK